MLHSTVSSLVYHYCQKEYAKKLELIISPPFNKETNFVSFELAEMNGVFKFVIFCCLIAINLICFLYTRQLIFSLEKERRTILINNLTRFKIPIIAEALRAIQNLSLFALYSKTSAINQSLVKPYV